MTLPRPSKPSWADYYLGLAIAVSWRSSCKGRSVGAVLVAQNRILTTGYNGTPEGWPNCLEEDGCARCKAQHDETDSGAGLPGRDLDECVCVHAEANALITAARFGIPLDAAEIFVTDQPCLQCAKELLQVGVSGLTYIRPYNVVNLAAARLMGTEEAAREVLANHHQLMRSLRARKHRNIALPQDLIEYLHWMEHKDGGKLAKKAAPTALDDDQYPQPSSSHLTSNGALAANNSDS